MRLAKSFLGLTGYRPKHGDLLVSKNTAISRRLISGRQTQPTNDVFDKKLRVKYMDRSAISQDDHLYDYLRDHVTKDVCDRIEDLNYKDKRLIFNIGTCSGFVTKYLDSSKVGALIHGDISQTRIRKCRKFDSHLSPVFHTQYVSCDEELLPLRECSTDLVMSSLDLHWVNDLVGCFRQVHKLLRKDSPFIGAMFGGDTLCELRSSLQLAELERLSGFSSHVAPKTTGQDIARLLQTCGFHFITVDVSEVKICYPSIFELMFDLQGMGENNSSLIGSRHMHRDVLKASAAIYHQLYGTTSSGDGEEAGIFATFQIIHFIGWKNPAAATQIDPKKLESLSM